ncbi:MAG: Lrp/AsnC family transcriptional regulator [Deltaproteobacteria bacterium]|nr:Lrp/AsnC family transcriptional regulator [Deltaproteobacteria bacterium]
MTVHPQVQLNDSDIMLIRELEGNARQSIVELARKLRTYRSTVKVRLQRLLDDRIIEILPIVDPLAMGYKTRVNLAFNTQPSEVDAVANALASRKNIRHVSVYTGRYDVMAWAILEKPEDLGDFVKKDLTGIAGITRIETMVNLEIVKVSYAYLSDQNYAIRSQPPQQALDALDLKLIEELRIDALQPQKDLAPKLGTSPSTIGKRLQRLLDEKIIYVVALVDPAVLGYNTRATIGINAQPHRVDAVARELASSRNVHHIVINTGYFDLIVSTDFKGPAELSKFVREDLGNIHGLVSHETMVCLETTKDDFAVTT